MLICYSRRIIDYLNLHCIYMLIPKDTSYQSAFAYDDATKMAYLSG